MGKKDFKFKGVTLLPRGEHIVTWACECENQQFGFPTRSDTNQPV